MQSRTQSNTWAWFGPAAMILGYVATWFVIFLVSESDAKAGGATLIEALDDGNNPLLFRITTGLGLIAASMLAVYGAGVRRALQRVTPQGSIVPNVAFTGFAAAAIVLAAGFIFRGMIFDSSGYYGDDPRIAFYVLGVDVPLGAWGMLAIASGASAYAAFALKVLPKWFGIFSAIVTVLIGLIWLTGTPPPGNIAAGPWLIASFFAFRNLGSAVPVAAGSPAKSGSMEPALG
jgi:hypothetical protein